MKKTSAILTVIFLITIVCIFLGNIISVYSWTALKLLFPIIGFVGLLIILIVVIFKKIVKKEVGSFKRMLLPIIICLVYMLPIFITLDFISIAFPSNIEKKTPSITVDWPLKEETVVAWGGDRIDQNRPHVMWGSERWAYDFVMKPWGRTEVKDTQSRDYSSQLENYGIWNAELVAPIEGTVISAYDKEQDIKPNTENFKSLEGNHVYLKIKKTGTYLLMNHLKKDSVTVSIGDKVSIGDTLGRIGNSGTTSEPHLHIHHQRQDPRKVLHPLFAEGLPLYFRNSEKIRMPVSNEVIHPN